MSTKNEILVECADEDSQHREAASVNIETVILYMLLSFHSCRH